MPSPKWLTYLGFCARTRGLKSGMQACSGLVKTGKCKLLLINSSMSQRQTQGLEEALTSAQVPWIRVAEDIGQAIGKPGQMMVAVTDSQWADSIYRQIVQQMAPTIAGVEEVDGEKKHVPSDT